ncbi:hypothetical protein [Sphingobacterium sp. 1.A.4]|uniref:hypothetical protein n=1 Tax=Sphingobacterium sp. 1.A.4 TaxID=2044603 RepID=UPI000C0C03A7|nr:hypothetical protein [Sphingobacterium sp. 1.A.4]
MEEKTCSECHRIIKGRSDKKFCDDNCRNVFNNRKNSNDEDVLRKINRKLKRNRRILETFLGEEKMVKVNKVKLLSEGFSIDYHTHILNTNKGQTYYFSYEYGFLEIENGMMLIVKNSKEKQKTA